MKNTEEIILNMKIKENAGIGRIIRTIRQRSDEQNTGDYILFSRVIITLAKNGIYVPYHQIIRHFKSIDEQDYAEEEKRDLLNNLKDINERTYQTKQPKESYKTAKKTSRFEVLSQLVHMDPIIKK